jgi:hypothetical protein
MDFITIWFSLSLIGGQPDPGYFQTQAKCEAENHRVLTVMQADGAEDNDMIGPCIEYKLSPAGGKDKLI